MRKHGWQLPYHPLQVVAVAVFLALGFAFYVFFLPFVGRKIIWYIVMGLYTPLVQVVGVVGGFIYFGGSQFTWRKWQVISSVFCLYIWSGAADPGDPGVFKSKKYLNIVDHERHSRLKESKLGGESTSSIHDANAAMAGEKPLDENISKDCHPAKEIKMSSTSPQHSSHCVMLLRCCLGALVCNCTDKNEESREQQMGEDGMFYCNLCEVEVFKYSKHCRVCDKCVDHFDHHCRWLNNCIGKKNYRQFFTLMVSALLLLILQWTVGIFVLICGFLEQKRFSMEITSKLGSSFSFAPFVVVVASCTILAMIATLPIAQLFFFHVLLIKKGISTYDYIIALREQDQQLVGGQQSPQMSPASSLTGLSSASSFNTFHRGAWCTPPRLFLEDQFDVVPPDTGMSVSSSGKKMVAEEPIRKKNHGTVKISPWALARLNADEVSKVAAEARKKSKILQPVMRRDAPLGLETDSSFGSSGRMVPKPDNRRRPSKRVWLPADLPLEPLAKISSNSTEEKSASLAPLQLEARSAFRTSKAMSASANIIASSPESSMEESPDLHPFRVSSSGAEEARGLTTGSHNGVPLSRSTSDGYEPSGGEDSDRVPSRIVHRSTNWSNLLFSSSRDDRTVKSKASSSSQVNNRKH
ncbi:hypothetical protein GIB67_020602 [Kingdonia uniflora]|uniref:S-acyltransferase n=1 Tax=Kingdonia uniflora TaxID=39325 RepID=A0A7J7M913_9MAGN|nr:hypothetical protein GIB67_020602 [Kingdonia uniflora]